MRGWKREGRKREGRKREGRKREGRKREREREGGKEGERGRAIAELTNKRVGRRVLIKSHF